MFTVTTRFARSDSHLREELEVLVEQGAAGGGRVQSGSKHVVRVRLTVVVWPVTCEHVGEPQA